MEVDARRSDRPIRNLIAIGRVGRVKEVGKSSRLLVPLDGSGLAEMAIPHAISLAQATSSELTLLQVVPTPVLYDPMGVGVVPSPAVWDAWEEEPTRAREYLRGVADVLSTQGVRVDTIVLEGDPAGAIVEYARQNPEVQMIAMTTHVRSGIRRWIVGSVAERVLHSTPVPLLLVRAEEKNNSVAEGPVAPAASAVSTSRTTSAASVRKEPGYRTITVPLDGSRFAEQALEEAQVLAARLNATLLLVSVVPPFDHGVSTGEPAVPLWIDIAEDEQAASMVRYLSGVTERLRDKDLKVQPEVVLGNPAEEILRSSEAGKADLIVMASHGRSGLQRLWLGSVAMKVVHAAKVPVLLIRVREVAEGPEAKTIAATPRA